MCNSLNAYKISLEIVNHIEFLLFKRLSKIFPVFGDELSFPKELEPSPFGVHKIYNWFTKQLYWFFQSVLKPILLITYTLASSVKKYYLLFTVILAIFFFVIRNMLIDTFSSVKGFSYNEEIALNVLFLVFILIALFTKIPAHGNKESELIKKCLEKLIEYDLRNTQWKLVLDDINIYKENFDKRVVFINSIFAFGWASYLLIFKTIHSYLPKESENMSEIFQPFFESFLCYFAIFTLIRSYTKIYKYIFELIKLSLNEVLFIQTEDKTDL